MIGAKFGRLTAIKELNKVHNQRVFLCKCECGGSAIVRCGNLRNGNTKSCGCLQKEMASSANTTHGYARSNTYSIWCDMKKRCHNPTTLAWDNYGGRGITVCDRWKNSFENFLKDMGTRPKGKHIDRKRNNEGYSPENCHWVTPKQNHRNKRNNRIICFNSESRTMAEWSEITGIKIGTIWMRLELGWPEEAALFKPLRKRIK